MMKGLKHIALASLCLLSFSSSGVYAQSAEAVQAAQKGITQSRIELDRIVAKIDQDVIMQSELDARLEAVHRQLASRNIALPPEEVLQKQVLEQLILENIQIQMGKRGGIRIDDWALNDAIARIAQRNQMTLEEFKQNLEADGLSFSQAREEIRREMILNRVRQRQVAQRVQVSEQEIDNFLSSPEGLSQMQTEYRLAHILIATPDNATPDQIQGAERHANDLSSQLRQGADFQALAIANSKGQNALEGGDLGWRKADQLPTLFAEQAIKMSKGQTSAPIRSPAGFHIFKLMDTRGNEKVVQSQVHVRHILIKPNEIRSNLESQMQAKKLYQRVQAGEEFSELAKAYSDDTASALNGGDMGWISPDVLVPEFQTVMNIIPQKVVSEPFRTTYGWHILEVLGKRQSDISTQVRRNQVRELLSNRKFEEELQVWLREVRDQTYVEIQL
ncbi:peptidylprolyl isomerase [Endozoicomonas elysicola]|uniref:peptidylprolyl isomerase n=1 Tax=Endozoicomonas elysicola TaxID=305900 RepID=UPI000360D4A5|nr:peptidylprolyl isomerase [Endozoicomonas elysicola]